MGVHYRDGNGCEQNYERAVEWLEKAVGQGYAYAMSTLESLYLYGCGVPRSYKRAFDLYQQSRAAGNTEPALDFNLGLCYEYGHGVAKDLLEARRLYTLAFVQGYAPASSHR